MAKPASVEVFRSSNDVYVLAIEPPTAVSAVREVLSQYRVDNPLVAGDLRVHGAPEDQLMSELSKVANIAAIYDATQPVRTTIVRANSSL